MQSAAGPKPSVASGFRHRFTTCPSNGGCSLIADLRRYVEVIDPTTLSGDEMGHEVQRVVKALLGYGTGAKLPKN